MTSRHHKDDLFIAEYTLGLLDAEQIAQAHALLGRDDEAVICALQWEARLLELTDALTPLHPSPALLARIQTTLGLPRNAPAVATAGRPSTPPPLAAESRPAPVFTAHNPQPAPSAQSGMAMDFEPRLIRPDAASTSVETSAPISTPKAAPIQNGQKSIPSNAAQPAPNHTETGEPGRVRAAPPDPMEAFRKEAITRKSSRKAVWRSLWFWRAMTAALAILAAVLVLPKETFRRDPASNASLQPAAAPTPKIVQVAIMQAPGLSSTPGWILTVDSRQNVVLAPQVDIVVPQSESVYLWTYNEQQPRPRLLGVIDPTRALTLPMEVTGEVSPGQIFEMTQEPNIAPPQEPDGPILFIGRTVSLG